MMSYSCYRMILCQLIFLSVAVVGTLNPTVDKEHSARILYSPSDSKHGNEHGHHSASKCPQVMTRSGEGQEMKLLEHEIWNHGDVCYDPTRNISCPKGCSPSNESGSDWLYCDMRWPRLTLYKEENGKEKRYPCRVPEESHGVKLASWRQKEYGTTIEILVVVLSAGLLKIVFHHVPDMIKNLESKDHIMCCNCIEYPKAVLRVMLQMIGALPESCVLIIAGIIVAVIFNWLFHARTIEFTPDLFFHYLLPPIIMDAAFAIYNKVFLHNFPIIVLYAVVGTLMNTFTIGGSLLLVQHLGGFSLPNETSTGNGEPTRLDPLNVFTFSALISAVDPVAVLAIFQEIGVNAGLYFMVFGESLLNDGVTIVLYNSMVALGGIGHVGALEIMMSIASFFFVVFGGFLIGVIFGFISTFIVKYTRHCREVEPFTVLTCIYLAFIVTEAIHWSGIIAILGCGIIQKRYAFRNISRKSFWTIKYGIRTAATFADCIIFICLGIVSVYDTNTWNDWNTSFALWTCIFCTLYRFGATFLLSGLINLFGSQHFDKVSLKDQFIIGYGGLRGAVGFSLALIIQDTNKFKDLFLTTAIFMVYFTTFLQGGTIKWITGLLSIEKAEKQVKNVSDDVHHQTINNLMGGIESVIGGIHRHTVIEVAAYFDKKYIEKWFLHDEAANLLAMKSRYIFLKEHYTRLYGPRVACARTGADSWGNEPGSSAARARVQTFVPESEQNDETHSICFKVDTEEDMKRLKDAFESHPYSAYTSNVHNPDADSPKALQDAIEHQQKRTSVLWDKAFSAHRRPSVVKRMSVSPTKKEFEKVDEEKEGMEDIIEVYNEVLLQSHASEDGSKAQTTVDASKEVLDDAKAFVEP